MPEDARVTLQGLLSMLEGLQNSPDDADYSNKCHNNVLMSLNSLLGRVDAVASTDADKTKQLVDFLPSALAILDFLREKCLEGQTNHIRTLSFQVLMAHPRATLMKLVANHSPILIETFGIFLALNQSSLDVKMEAFVLLQLLEWLPNREKAIYVKQGIPLWLSKVLPTLVEILTTVNDNEKIETIVRRVELLTNQLVLFDYFDYPEWRTLVDSIVDPKKFPASTKSLLDNGRDTWHRIWIIIVKLLKNQVTRNISSFGSPINSMLPVVETAFKKESPQRVRAFSCWNELIINFSNETNVNCIAKRIKLVIIPLKLNNTKTEEAIVAKFHTWWLLIRKFKLKMEQFANEILIPFLHFVFGKEHGSKPKFWAGQLSRGMRVKCLEAFVEIVGHSDCTTKCTKNVIKLNGKIINTVLLADHWNHWVYALKAAVKLVASNFTDEFKKNIRCIWKSFVLLMAELLDNSVRRDLFNELVNLLSELVQDCKLFVDLPEILIDDLVLPLFSDGRVRPLLNSMGQEHRPMNEIVKILMDKTFDNYYNKYQPQELMLMLDTVVIALIADSVTMPAYMIWILDELPATESALKLWTALARRATECDLCQQVLNSILRWPFKMVQVSTDVKEAASAWYTLYNVMHVKLDMMGFDKEISKVLTKPVEDSKAANYFFMFALIGVLKHRPDEDKMAKLEALTDEMTDYTELEQIMPSLVDTLVLMLDYVGKKEDENLAQITINCVKNVLRVNHSETGSCESNKPSIESRKTTFSELGENTPLLNKTVLSDTILTAVKKYLAKCSNESIKSEIRKVISSHDKSNDKKAIESPKNTDVVAPKEFASPKIQDVKKTKRKEPNIVNTVVEDGEEYLVVKSNWKFNPKNLTENQKEKLQRKREIPALYQDLSQSQDEFKLSTWKTDSQDTSLSSSKSSKSATDASEILLNMPSSDVVPKIMENILVSKSTTPKTNANTSPVSKDKSQKNDKTTPIGTKSPRMALKDRVFRNVRNLIEKSSTSPQNKILTHEVTNQIDNVSKSPVSKSKNDNLVNLDKPELLPEQKPDHRLIADKQENLTPNVSHLEEEANSKRLIIVTAKQNNQKITFVCEPLSDTKKTMNISNSTTPPLLIGERPARMKRKPKKFDDSLVLGFKKSRKSNNDSRSDSQYSQDSQQEITIAQVHAPKDKNDNMENDIDKFQQDLIEVEAVNKGNDNEGQTIIDSDVMVIENDIIIPIDKDIIIPIDKDSFESHITKDSVPVTPTTPSTDNPTEKSPEKPTNLGEIPTNMSKASEGIENEGTQIKTKEIDEQLPIVSKPLNKIKEANEQKLTPKQASAQTDEKFNTITTPLNKLRKSKVQNENIINDGQTLSVTPISKTIDPSLQKASEKKSNKEKHNKEKHNKTNKDNEKLEIVSTPINKGDKDQSKSAKKRVVQKETTEIDEKLEPVSKLLNKTEDVSQQKSTMKDKDLQTENKITEIKLGTPKNKVKDVAHKSSTKNTAKKSRIEKELMIDTVEGHPFLKSPSEKRLTRNKIMEAENSGRRRSLADKINKSKLDATPKTTKKPKDKKTSPTSTTVTVEDSQDRRSISPEVAVMDEPPCSEDIIESSQDSTMTTISVKSTKRTSNFQPFVAIKKINIATTETQELIQDCEMINVCNKDQHEKTDIELSQNKTVEVDKNTTNLTENMDTEPMDDDIISNDVIILSESVTPPIEMNSEPPIGPETQEFAEADTQPNDPKDFVESEVQPPLHRLNEIEITGQPIEIIDNDITQSLPEAALILASMNMTIANEVSSPYKDDSQRKQDFLNNTLEISPIKSLSPDRAQKAPSPETSSDFVVIKLSSPVQSNGEPFEKQGSPEFFTEDKVSPDKRDASPPRAEVTVTNTSPSSSLSLKKNRPQVRPGGRAAQMLGLCVNSDLKLIKVADRNEPEETKKPSTSTPARRNLRILYNSVGENSDNLPDNTGEDPENFLKLNRTLPTVTSSPSFPILKRKLIDITDEATASPASKRKRVSFHDPPVSTTIAVHKYIEPLSMLRSPQSSGKKRLERQTRSGIKSPKRLENAFNLDSVLSKTVESFTETNQTPTDDTQNISLDITPAVEIVKTSDLNDTDPICPDLIDCNDPIDVIATELSSPAMRELFIKELEGKVETVGDLAKMTELEVNRLCIKAPKIQIAKKVLMDYIANRPAIGVETVIEEAFSEPMAESLLNESKTACVEMQTDEVEVSSTEMQTVVEPVMFSSTQTDSVCTAHSSMQTDEPTTKTTADIISSCLADKEDFVEKLREQLLEGSIKTIAEKLSPKSLFDLLIKKSDDSTMTSLQNKLLKHQSKGVSKDKKSSVELSFLRDHLCERYESRDLILLCSQILQQVHDKPA